MAFASDIAFKPSDKLEAGELINVRNNQGQFLAIVGTPVSDTFPMLTLQPADQLPAFSYIPRVRHQDVATFGKNWILEPSNYLKAFVGNRDFNETPGLLRLTEKGAFLQCFSDRNECNFNVSTGELVDPQYSGTLPVQEWRVWSSAQSKVEIGASPLMTFVATRNVDE